MYDPEQNIILVLEKKNEKGNTWNNRWFVLKPKYIYYFDGEEVLLIY